jgi:CRISPR-associated protein (TIGR03986 family)
MPTLPKHTRRIDRQRRATAPYNFIMLPDPEEMLICLSGHDIQDAREKGTLASLLERKLPRHDRFYPKLRSGYFDVELETLSPLYVRSTLTSAELDRQSDDADRSYVQRAKNKSDFFYTDTQRNVPVIPGSSLRGLLRSVVEIISFGKPGALNPTQLFFRDPSNRGSYQEKMTQRDSHNGRMAFLSLVKTGRLVKNGDRWQVQSCRSARVHLADVANAFGLAHSSKMYRLKSGDLKQGDYDNPNQYPKKEYQHATVWLRNVGPEMWHEHGLNGSMYLYYAKADEISNRETPGSQKGQLLLTGPMQKKSRAFVFVEPDTNSDPVYDVPPQLIESLNSNAQITDWQENAFSASKGKFVDGSLVLFLHEGNNVTAMGRSQLFRIGYDNTVGGLLPPGSQNPAFIDFAEAMFGYTRTDTEIKILESRKILSAEDDKQGHPLRAYASRISVTNAVLSSEVQDDPYLSATPTTLRILGTPHPSSYQLYLTQPDQPAPQLDRNNRKVPPPLHDYNSASTVVAIRGSKRYWNKGAISLKDIQEPNTPSEKSTQHTLVKPLKPGVRFTFRVHFTNLNDFELSLLSWAISLGLDNTAPTTRVHSLGMGKPLGMGAVRLRPKLVLTDRAKRYESAFGDGGWQTGEATAELLNSRFESTLVKSPARGRAATFEDIPRVQQFLKMVKWQENLSEEQRAEREHQTLSERRNDFKDRKVLPDPRDVP